MTAMADKIRKLIAKADSSTHSEEASTFMAKAQAMMIEHGLSLLDLGRLNQDDPLGEDKDAMHTWKSSPWAKPLIFQLAEYYGCQALSFSAKLGPNKNKYRFNLIGRESARITATLMIPFIIRQTKSAARAAFNFGEYLSYPKAETRIGNAMVLRVEKLNLARAREVPTARGFNSLVPVNEIKALMDQLYSEAKEAPTPSRLMDWNAIAAADQINLDLQIHNPDALRIAK
ncbi:MAG: DUF2786 domain-containing protein [Beijerinckiaceae bacterium]